jgi:hypothetical protein
VLWHRARLLPGDKSAAFHLLSLSKAGPDIILVRIKPAVLDFTRKNGCQRLPKLRRQLSIQENSMKRTGGGARPASGM